MADTCEGYLTKKIGYTRSLKRYYYWDGAKLYYWKDKEDKDKSKEAKDSLPAADFEKVVPDPEGRNDRFTLHFKHKTLLLKGDADDIRKWIQTFENFRRKSGEMKSDEHEDEDTANWTIEQIIDMMSNGQVMAAYFSNNTKKNFKLYCRDYTLYACPVNAGIEKAIISLPLRRISDIYVDKQTPGFDTEVASAVPFDRCFTVISRKYTLDVEAKSYQMATHWLAGIKYLLTKSGKAVIVNEQEAGTEPQAQESEQPTQQDSQAPEQPEQPEQPEEQQAENAQAEETPSGGDQASPVSAAAGAESQADVQKAEAEAAAAILGATKIAPEVGEGSDLELDFGDDKKSQSALIVVDVQNDFLPPSGCIIIKDGLAVIPVINKLKKRVQWGAVIFTQRWHPENHMSFFVVNKDKPGAQLFQPLELGNGRTQMMWPSHCVAESNGAAFHPELAVDPDSGDKIVRKGLTADAPAASGFSDPDGKWKTDLEDILKKANIADVFITGLMYDYGVVQTALDAKNAGYNVYVVDDACRGYNDDTTKKAKDVIRKEDISIISSETIPDSGTMPQEYDEVEDDEEEEMDPEQDSGNEAAKSPQQLALQDFLSEFIEGFDAAAGGARKQAEDKPKSAAEGGQEDEQEGPDQDQGQGDQEAAQEAAASVEPEDVKPQAKSSVVAPKPAPAAPASVQKPADVKKPAVAATGPGAKKPGVTPAPAGPGARKPPVGSSVPPTGRKPAGVAAATSPPAGNPGVRIHAQPVRGRGGATVRGRGGASVRGGRPPAKPADGKSPSKPAPGTVRKPGGAPAPGAVRKPGVPGVPGTPQRKTPATPVTGPGVRKPPGAVTPKKPVEVKKPPVARTPAGGGGGGSSSAKKPVTTPTPAGAAKKPPAAGAQDNKTPVSGAKKPGGAVATPNSVGPKTPASAKPAGASGAPPSAASSAKKPAAAAPAGGAPKG